MNILVTGGAGYIGSVFVEKACDAGHEVVVVDNLSTGNQWAVDRRSKLIVDHVSNFYNFEFALKNAQAVVHLAGSALVEESVQDPGYYFLNNVAVAIPLLRQVRRLAIPKFVFSSSCAVYGRCCKNPITEDTPPDPCNPYGASKLAFEDAARWILNGRTEFVSLRFFNAAGATEQHGEDRRVETHLIPLILREACKADPQVKIFGLHPTPDQTCVRDYVHVEEIADAILKALEPGRAGTFNLGTGRGHSVKEVIAACSRVTGKPITTIAAPARAGDPAALVADPQRAKEVLGWQARRSLDEMVESAWKWKARNDKIPKYPMTKQPIG